MGLSRVLNWLRKAATVVALLSNVDKFGANPIVGGKDTDMRITQRHTAAGAQIILANDAGDLQGWMRVKLSPEVGLRTVAARLAGRDQLLRVMRRREDPTWFDIEGMAAPDVHAEKFMWPAGVAFVIYSADGLPSSATVVDWELFLSDSARDSALRSRNRRIYFWVSLVFLIIMGVSAWPRTTPEEASPQADAHVTAMIEEVEGTTPLQTKALRDLLRAVVLKRIPAKDALAAIDEPFSKRLQLWALARHGLRVRIEHQISYLQSCRSLLE